MSYNFSKILKEKALKVTKPRLLILSVCASANGPLCAEDIHIKLQHEKINLTTVYRTLHSLEKADVLKRVDLHTDSVLYELPTHHHHHIVCTLCGLIEAFDECGMDSLVGNVVNDSKKFSTVQDHSLELFGICNACSRA
jgi:Fe2+ or Zn2+ uptake regulation protein